MPTEPAESDFKERLKIKSYPAKEFGGVVWVYMGPKELEPELPQFEWARVPDDHRVVRTGSRNPTTCRPPKGRSTPRTSASITAGLSRITLRRLAPAATHDGRWHRSPRTGDGAPRLTVKETDYGFIYGSRRRTPARVILLALHAVPAAVLESDPRASATARRPLLGADRR